MFGYLKYISCQILQKMLRGNSKTSKYVIIVAGLAMISVEASQQGDTFCTQEYNPVCGQKNGKKAETFSNKCRMNVARAKFLHTGKCDQFSGITLYPATGGQSKSFGDDKQKNTFCTQEYNPVCGQKNGEKAETFSNKCLMNVARATFLHTGKCDQFSGITLYPAAGGQSKSFGSDK